MATQRPGPHDGSNPYEARAALQDLDESRARFGQQLATPWWYKLASASIVAAMFVGAGMPYQSLALGSATTGASLLVVAVIIGPLGLRELLKRSTGASFDRYRNGWTVPSFMLIGLFLTCVLLQKFADVDLAPLLGAVVGFCFTYLYEGWTDRRLARGHFPTDAARDRS